MGGGGGMGGMGRMMAGGRGMSGSPWGLMRSFRRDSSVTSQKLPAGITRRIASFARPYRKSILWLIGMLLVDSMIGVANPLLLRKIINRGILGHDPGLIVTLAAVVAALAVADAALSLVERFFSARIGEGLIFDMRSKVFSHIQRMPIAFFTRTQTGALISRLDNDVMGAQQAFTSTLTSVVGNFFTVSITLAVMMDLSWEITLASVMILPLFIYLARVVGRRLQVLARDSYNLNAAMTSMMNERFNVAGALLAKLYGRPSEEDGTFSGHAGKVRDIGVSIAMYGQVFFVSMMLVTSLASALVYGWGGWQAVHGALNVGTVVALIQLLTRLFGPMTQLSNVNVDVMTALVSFDRVFEVLDLEPMVADKPSATDLPNEVASVEFDHVDFRYPTAREVSLASLESVAVLDSTPDKQVLYDISFTAAPGEMIALVGPSGAGKTTISQLVTRMYDVTSGAVRIGGTDVRDLTMESLRSAIGVVTQDAHMFHDTIRSNLLYADPSASEADLVDACREAQIWELVERLPDGLDTLVGDRGYRLSGGEKQRLAIARLLLKSPGIVVLDEATAHLDSEVEAAVQRAFRTALAGRTSIVIAHRLSTVRQADTILVVEDGRIVERGSHAELLAAEGLYAVLYRTQFLPGADVESGGAHRMAGSLDE